MSLIRQMLQDSPSAYWPLNDGTSTTARDISGNGRHLTWSAAPVQGSLILPGGGVTLNGAKQASIADASWQTPTSGTFEIWAYLTAISPILALASHRAVAAGWAAYISPSSGAGTFQLSMDGTGTTLLASPTGAVVVSTLVQLALGWEYGGGVTTGYLTANGVQVATGSMVTHALIDGSDTFYLLGEAGTRYATGTFAHAAVYGSRLSADRLKAHYQAGIRSGVLV